MLLVGNVFFFTLFVVSVAQNKKIDEKIRKNNLIASEKNGTLSAPIH